MGFFDKLSYVLAPLFGPVGKGISDNVQDSRLTDAVRQVQGVNNLTDFAATPSPDDIYSPEHLLKLEQMRLLKQGVLQQSEAAPIAGAIDRIRSQGFDADPNFTGQEWTKGMLTTPALGGNLEPSQYDAMKTGTTSLGKKGSMPISSFEANPVVAKLIQDAELAAQQKGNMARMFRDKEQVDPMTAASIAMNKDHAASFENTAQGLGQFGTMEKRNLDMATDRAKPGLEAKSNQAVNDLTAFASSLLQPEDNNGKPQYQNYKVINDRLANFASGMNIKPEDYNRVQKDLEKQMESSYQPDLAYTVKTGNDLTKFMPNNYGYSDKKLDKDAGQTIKIDTGNGSKEARARKTDFWKDENYKRTLERAVIKAQKSDTGSALFSGEDMTAADLNNLLSDHKSTMLQLYPEELAERAPKTIPKGSGNQVKTVVEMDGKKYRRTGPGPNDWALM